MNILEAKQIRLVDYLSFLGFEPKRVLRGQYWYNSPFRDEKTPSFKVNDHLNEWYDFGIAEGGDIIELGKYLHKTNDVSFVLGQIAKHATVAPPMRIKPESIQAPAMENVMTNVEIHDLHNVALLSYIKSRMVNVEVAQRYCKEIYYNMGRKRYFAIAFENRSRGLEVRNAYFKGCMKNKDITLIYESSYTHQEHICIFEGFMDFLSYKTMKRTGNDTICLAEHTDFLILNSVSNLKKCLEELGMYSVIHCYLDNDLAGQKTTETIRGMYEVRVKDESVRYQNYKDLNDLLRGKLM